MASDLVALARKFVSLSEELDQVRREIKQCALNGAGGDIEARPPPAGVRPGGTKRTLKARPERPAPRVAKPAKPKAKPPSRAEVLANAKAAEEQTLALIRQKPNIRTREIIAATGAKDSTTAERLWRLKDVGLIVGGHGAGWTAGPQA